MFIQAFRWKSVKERWWCLKRKKCTSQNPSSLTRTCKEYCHKVKPIYSCFKYTKCSYIKCDAMFYGKMSMFSLRKDLSALLFNSTEKGWYLCFKIRFFILFIIQRGKIRIQYLYRKTSAINRQDTTTPNTVNERIVPITYVKNNRKFILTSTPLEAWKCNCQAF